MFRATKEDEAGGVKDDGMVDLFLANHAEDSKFEGRDDAWPLA